MKKNIIMSGVLTLALSLFTIGCSWFESDAPEDKGPYYRDLATPSQQASSTRKNPGDADLHSGGSSDLNDANQPGKFSAGSGLENTYDGFGTPIAGITFNPIYFGFDQFAIGSGEMNKINDVVTYLNNNPGTGIVIEGNCDNRGTEEYNRALGERRALAAQEQILNAGIAANRIKTISNGKAKLAAQGENEEAHKLNRRDEFIAVRLLK